MTYCTSPTPHWFCLRCAKAQADTLIGQSKWDLRCMDTSGCKSVFARAQVERFVDAPTLKRLDALHFVSSTRNVPGLEGMVECPFCDFRALVDPLDGADEDTWWFFCLNPSCSDYSCRKCKGKWHPGKKCGAVDKEKKLDVRHLVEEAMSDALIQKCNSCKARFIKEVGCNKMTCTDCGNLQCYLCKKSISGQEHFHQLGSKCELFTNDAARHVDDVKAAENAAIEKVLKDHPELTREDLKVEMSAKVKADETRAIQKGKHPEMLILEEDMAVGRDPLMPHEAPDHNPFAMRGMPPRRHLNPAMRGPPVFGPHAIPGLRQAGFGAPAPAALMERRAIMDHQTQRGTADEELARLLHEQFLDEDHAARQREAREERRNRAIMLRVARAQQVLMPPARNYGIDGYGAVDYGSGGMFPQGEQAGYGRGIRRPRRRLPPTRLQWPTGEDDFDRDYDDGR